MATEQQIQQIIDMMQQQMTQLTNLQAENTRLRSENTVVSPAVANADTNNLHVKSKKPDRPVINAGIDDREWAIFTDTWSRYKRMIGISAANVDMLRMELRESCSSDVNKLECLQRR